MNISDEELATIQKVCKKVMNKYSFAHYTPEDIYNEAFIIACDGLSRYNGKNPLENFLSVHVSNRLKNFIRKNYNPKKHNLINAIPIYNVDDTGEESMKYSTDNKFFFSKELEDYIDQHLQAKYRIDYIKLLEGEMLIPSRKKLLKAELTEIMKKFYKENE